MKLFFGLCASLFFLMRAYDTNLLAEIRNSMEQILKRMIVRKRDFIMLCVYACVNKC